MFCDRAGPLGRLIGAGLALLAPLAEAQLLELEIAPTADTSIYQDANDLSNGAGIYLFSGRIANGLRRRALLRFDDLSAIPDDAIIQEVVLRLTLSRKREEAGPITFFLHRLLAPWGEANSDAGVPGGMGIAADDGDATWSHRFFPNDLWAEDGGDFDAESSTSRLVDDVGDYEWPSTERTLNDLALWRADPSANHGWVVVDRLTAPLAHARRFHAREDSDPALQPRLIIRYDQVLLRDGFESP